MEEHSWENIQELQERRCRADTRRAESEPTSNNQPEKMDTERPESEPLATQAEVKL